MDTLSQIAYKDKPSGRNSIRQAVVAEHGTIKLEHILEALQQGCQNRAKGASPHSVDANSLIQKCMASIKNRQQLN